MVVVNQNPKKRIAMISEHASPLADLGSVDSGGQNVYVAQVARYLARQGYHVDVFTRKDDESLPDIMVWEDGVRVVHVPAGPPEFVRKEDLLPFMDDFARFMIEFIQRQGQHYDLVHANFWMSAIVAADIKKELGIPYVVTFHALGRVRRQHQGEEDGFPDVRFEMEDHAVTNADTVIAECPQDEEDLFCLYQADPQRISVIPCGFDPSEIWPVDKAQARRILGFPEDERIILQLGRLVPRKGVDNVVRGFARLVNEYGIQARLVIVGGESEVPDPEITPEIGRLQEIARSEGVEQLVTFIGRRGRKEIKYYYSAADVFVSTPWYEPFGITPVEAMACGTPVIGADVGGIKFTVRDGETGFLVPPDDPEALGDRLAELYQNPNLLERFGRRAVQRVNELFTWETVTASIAALYEQVLSAHKPDRSPRKRKAAATPANGSPVSHSLPENGAMSLPDSAATAEVEVVQRHFQEAIRTLKRSWKVVDRQILEIAHAIIQCIAGGGKVMVCGNGGSAAEAQHFSAELLGRFQITDRPGLPVLSLTTDTAFLTAWSNDISFDDIFARQVQALGQPGDLIIALSTSGSSRNLLRAFEQARASGIATAALLGGDGGDLLPFTDLALLVPDDSTPRIQEVHLLAIHSICELVEQYIAAQGASSTQDMLTPVLPASRPAWAISSSLAVQQAKTLR